MATARGTNGTTLKVDISSVDTVIGLLEAVKPPKPTVMTERLEPIDSDHSTPVYTGRIDNDTATFSVYLDPLDAAHAYLMEITHDPSHTDAGDLKTWTVTLPVTGIDPWIFTGIAKDFDTTVEKASLLKAQGTIDVDETTQLPLATA